MRGSHLLVRAERRYFEAKRRGIYEVGMLQICINYVAKKREPVADSRRHIVDDGSQNSVFY